VAEVDACERYDQLSKSLPAPSHGRLELAGELNALGDRGWLSPRGCVRRRSGVRDSGHRGGYERNRERLWWGGNPGGLRIFKPRGILTRC